MSGLAGLLAGHLDPGIYRWHAAFEVDDVRHAVERAEGRFVYLDGWHAQTREEFLDAIGTAFGFPDYYGRNFDALLDCLRDVGTYDDSEESEPDVDADASSTPEPPPTAPDRASIAGTILLWDGWGPFAYADERGFSIALSVLWQRVSEDDAGRFSVMLRGDGPEPADVPTLD